MPAQFQIPDYEGENRARVQERQNAMLQKSHLATAGLQQQAIGMQNQDMAREMANRAELESLLTSTPPEQRDRVGLEWLKMKDPEKAAKLQAVHLKRLEEGLKINPQQATTAYKMSTGEDLKYDPASGVVEVPMTDGTFIISPQGSHFSPTKATVAQRGTVLGPGSGFIPPGQDKPTYTQPFKEGAAGKQIERTVDLGTTVEYIYTDGTRETKPKGQFAQRAPASTVIYAGENIDQWAEALGRGEVTMTEIPAPIRGKVLEKTRGAGNTVVPKKVREQVTALRSARSLVAPLRTMVADVTNAKNPIERTRASLILKNYGQSVAGRIARSFGEVGTMNEGDINRATGLVPGIISSNFDSTFANRELDWLDSILDAQEKNFTQQSFGTVKIDGSGGGGGDDKVIVEKGGKKYRLPRAQLERAKSEGYTLSAQ